MIRLRTSIVASVVLTTVWACSSSNGERAAAASCVSTEIIAAASDYSTSTVCGAPPCDGPNTTGADLGSDPSLAASNGRVFFVARMTDQVFELDPRCGTPLRSGSYSVAQPDAKGIANPYDVAAAKDGALFVVLYNLPRIVVLKDGKQDGPPIDLSSYDDDDNPQANAIRIVEIGGVEKAFVSLERLDNADLRNVPRPARMLRIDVATRRVEAVIELAGRNPFNTMGELNGKLFLAEPGNFNADDDDHAGIERFDTATSTTQLLIAEKDLGGSVAEVAVADGCGAAIIAGKQTPDNPTSLVTFDPETGRVLSTSKTPLLATPGFDLQALAWKGDTLYVGDRRRGGTGYQIHAFEREPGTCKLQETGRAITLPQAPVAIRAASR